MFRQRKKPSRCRSYRSYKATKLGFAKSGGTDAGMAQIGPTLRPPPIGGGHHRTSRTIRAESEGSEAFSKLETAYVSDNQVCGSGPRLAKCNRTQAMSTLAHPPFLNAKISSRQNDEISHLAGIALNDGASRFKIRAGSKNRR
jgi:hypothetical protein